MHIIYICFLFWVKIDEMICRQYPLHFTLVRGIIYETINARKQIIVLVKGKGKDYLHYTGNLILPFPFGSTTSSYFIKNDKLFS